MSEEMCVPRKGSSFWVWFCFSLRWSEWGSSQLRRQRKGKLSKYVNQKRRPQSCEGEPAVPSSSYKSCWKLVIVLCCILVPWLDIVSPSFHSYPQERQQKGKSPASPRSAPRAPAVAGLGGASRGRGAWRPLPSSARKSVPLPQLSAAEPSLKARSRFLRATHPRALAGEKIVWKYEFSI